MAGFGGRDDADWLLVELFSDRLKFYIKHIFKLELNI